MEFLTFLTDKANNKYDPKQESRLIMYLDANNFYGYAMSKFLSKSSFKWTDPKEFNLILKN